MIFWGATGQAKVLGECMKDSGLKLFAWFDNNESLVSPFADIPLYYGQKGFESWMSKRESDAPVGFLVAIGGDKGKDRVEIQEYLESYGLVALLARHPTAFIADNVRIGGGSQVLANSSVCVETIIGRGCIINTGTIVDHECRIDDGVHVCPGAHLAGCVDVGRYSTIGTGAVILPRVRLGQGVIVGAGAVVIEDVLPYTVVAGNPGRVIRKITKGKK
ncbi:MAG: NeuD/PglB/VioB family sugar acetyltransferase [Spirochaetales bacterium]|nr:NeuD/PglB/VioB family sugar acetyltransferase [Spirochaetales bacterium]